jgi:hypothetical protein
MYHTAQQLGKYAPRSFSRRCNADNATTEAAERLAAGDGRLPLSRGGQQEQDAAPFAGDELHGPLGLLVGPNEGYRFQFLVNRRHDLAFHDRGSPVVSSPDGKAKEGSALAIDRQRENHFTRGSRVCQ